MTHCNQSIRFMFRKVWGWSAIPEQNQCIPKSSALRIVWIRADFVWYSIKLTCGGPSSWRLLHTGLNVAAPSLILPRVSWISRRFLILFIYVDWATYSLITSSVRESTTQQHMAARSGMNHHVGGTLRKRGLRMTYIPNRSSQHNLFEVE